ncbi:MAG TPA: tRNA 2-selenouridine(34) synthase MnmH [Chitinophagales bacterium]|nr:tRNA 2-selenouridine(34) synthase MnmH [Chitinophagales bacterium]HNO28395.1 tRNA 2-selenouridine(34) synthase MnmH [Chitinophagales bacterium]
MTISAYLSDAGSLPLVDVRSPGEFATGHIPGAVNIPLFDNSERAQVGILYKHEGRQAAIRKGLSITGPKLDKFIHEASALAKDNAIAVHCWRGGMRSQSMATLFDFAGFQTKVLKGGYKSYRGAVHALFSSQLTVYILGGRTGSGKTKILQALRNAGEQVADLEHLAHHKGSAFGDLGEEPQPSTEMFENLLFESIRNFDLSKPIWIEDESHLIGSVFIPEALWQQMRNAPVFFCDVPIHERIQFLIHAYGQFPAEQLIGAVKKITKRLGGQHAKAAVECFERGDLFKATEIVLGYYDKAYAYGLTQRAHQEIHTIEMSTINPEINAQQLIDHVCRNAITEKNISTKS